MRQLTMKAGVNECAIYSLAMVLDLDPKDIMKNFPSYYVPLGNGRAKGLHIQEVIDYLLRLGYSCTVIEDKAFECGEETVIFEETRFWNHVASSKGVLVGFRSNNKCHANANDHGIVFDPAITKLKMEYFQYWRIDRIRSNTINN